MKDMRTKAILNFSLMSSVMSSVLLVLLVAGCAKKQPVASTPPPPPMLTPTASISANPNTIEKGQSTQITWRTENATDIDIAGIGKVEANGSQSVSPSDSTSYRLVAKGPGGTQEATTRVTVVEAPSTPVAVKPTTQSDQQWFAQNIQDVYFDYDTYEIRPDGKAAIATGAKALAQKPGIHFMIAGHCDERGSTDYNIALGDKRANAVKDALVAAGVSASRISVTSFGKEKPFCGDSTEECWQKNRRGHFVIQ